MFLSHLTPLTSPTLPQEHPSTLYGIYVEPTADLHHKSLSTTTSTETRKVKGKRGRKIFKFGIQVINQTEINGIGLNALST